MNRALGLDSVSIKRSLQKIITTNDDQTYPAVVKNKVTFRKPLQTFYHRKPYLSESTSVRAKTALDFDDNHDSAESLLKNLILKTAKESNNFKKEKLSIDVKM